MVGNVLSELKPSELYIPIAPRALSYTEYVGLLVCL